MSSNLLTVYQTVSSNWGNLLLGNDNQVLAADSTITPSNLKWVDQASGTVISITQGTGLSFSANPLITSGTINIATTGVSSGTYVLPSFNVNSQGQLTSVLDGEGNSFLTGTIQLSNSSALITDANIISTSNVQLTYNSNTAIDPATTGVLYASRTSGSASIYSNHASDGNYVDYLIIY